MITAIISAIAEVAPKLTIPEEVTGKSTYAVARMLMRFARETIHALGIPFTESTFIAIYAVMVFLLSFLLGWILKYLIVLILRHIRLKKKSSLYNIMVKHRFFIRSMNIIPPLVFLILIQFTLYTHESIAMWLTRFSWVYVAFVIALSLCTLADCIWEHLDLKDNKRKLPLHGVVQIIKIIVWILTLIICVAILVNRSPGTLLAGLGAFAAVLMLIFKDSILGVVAGVQLAQNDSLHVGDWIAVPGTQANGTVAEVSLTAVKILNWDMTVTTVPPYGLITNGFTNYRHMQESGTRRIQRSYMIDADSVVETTDEMLEDFRQIPMMKEWIDTKVRQRNEGKTEDVNNSEGLADGSIDTNLGIFRAYMLMWLQSNPNISHLPESTCFVTTLAQTSAGIPLQIYCFTSTSAWVPYEGIQASVFEHMAVMMYRFHLYVFENPSGRDTLIDGYLSPGKDPEFVAGMPYPFFRSSGTPFNPGVPPAGLYPGSPATTNDQEASNTVKSPAQNGKPA